MPGIRILLFACVGLLASCVASSRGESHVGDAGPVDRTRQRALDAEYGARSAYAQMAPKTTVRFVTKPEGALVEWHSREGYWVAVGNTPDTEIVIEATGRPELFRVSKQGYLPQSRWVASPGGRPITVALDLMQELPQDRFILNEAR